MNYQWQSPTRPTAYNESNTSLSPLSIRSRFENAVPPGTVASRVHHIQSLANSTTLKPPKMASTRRREYSRTGFGRRVSSRFGQPASRNGNPNEQLQVDSNHSYLGLNIARTNHEQEHAIANHRARYDRTPGLHGLMEPKGLVQRVQYDAASPWSSVPPTTSRPAHITREANSLVEDTSSEIDGYFAVPKLPQANDETETPDTYCQEYRSRMEDTMKSDQTFLTTSTIRQQSVRDIFYEYGIERPAGLVPEESSRDLDNTPRPPSHKVCHVCSWTNYSSNMKCRRCAHALCGECDKLAQPLNHQKETSFAKKLAMKGKEAPKPDPPKKENSPVESEGTNLSEGLLSHSTQNGRCQGRKVSVQVEKFPSFHDIQPSRRTSQKDLCTKTTVANQQVVLPLVSGTRTTTTVKNSPFLIADMLSNGIALHLHPVGVSTEERNSHDHLHSIEIKHHHHSSQSSSFECDSPACRATHDGHEPYRYSSACGEKKRRSPMKTDAGYVADTSRGEDENDEGPGFNYSHLSRSTSRKSQTSKEGSNSAQKVNITRKGDFFSSEYVECHGYPRTGHARHGSFPSGDIGECQHCLEDCQCTACQRTHHNVRCCVHEDHSSIVHKHHTHKLTASAPKPLECATSPKAEEPQKRPSKASTTRLPSSRKLSTPPRLAKQSKPTSPLVPVIADPVKKRPSLMTSQKSSFIKEIQSPPFSKSNSAKTSISSISKSSRNFAIKGTKATAKEPIPMQASAREDPSKRKKSSVSEPKQQTPTKSFQETPRIPTPPQVSPNIKGKLKPIADTKPFKDRPQQANSKPTIPSPVMEARPVTQPVSPVESYRGQKTERTWVTEQSDNDHEKAHNRRESCNFPLRKTPLTVGKELQCPSVGVPFRKDVTKDTASRKVPKNLSSTYQLREERTMTHLNEKFLEHQHEFRQIRQECETKIEAMSERGDRQDKNPEPERSRPQIEEARKVSTMSSQGAGRKGWWPLKLVDREPSPVCPNDEISAVEEHRLSQDETIEQEVVLKKGVEEHKLCEDEVIEVEEILSNGAEEHQLGQDNVGGEEVASGQIVTGMWIEPPQNGEAEHECVWKRRYLDGSSRNEQRACGTGEFPLVGITVILHMEGREDLVIRSDLRTGASAKGIGR